MSYIKADNGREQIHFDFLEDLRRSGDTNMFGASPYLQAAFGIGKERAVKTLSKWMKLHDDPKRILRRAATSHKTECRFVTDAKIVQVPRK